jgi:hypothetical protein
MSYVQLLFLICIISLISSGKGYLSPRNSLRPFGAVRTLSKMRLQAPSRGFETDTKTIIKNEIKLDLDLALDKALGKK